MPRSRFAAAGVRPRPPLPFDAGVIGAEPGVPEHQPRDHRQRRQQDAPAAADRFAEDDEHRQRDREIIRVALLQAERARPVAEVLEDPARRGWSRRRRSPPRPPPPRSAGCAPSRSRFPRGGCCNLASISLFTPCRRLSPRRRARRLTRPRSWLLSRPTSPCGGIGRRGKLKICWWQHRAGSSPARGTRKIPQMHQQLASEI